MKRTWSVINGLINKNCKPKFPKCFRDGDKNIENTQDIANEFNNFFSKIGVTLAEKIPPTAREYNEFLDPKINESMFMLPTNKNEIEEIVKSFNGNKSPGPDDISCKVLKSVIDEISEPLAYIFNLSFTSGIVPNILKNARITPIFKNGDDDIFTNYRPVSVLSCISKILERLVYNRLHSFVSKHKIIKHNQFGFRKEHSTSQALTKIVDKISKNLDNGNTVIGVFLDLSKEFDTINHEILLGKLKNYGVRGVPLSWIRNYLSQRQQTVKIENTSSDVAEITCGIPQGSILGPLLFILYMNDCANVTDIAELIMFADDTNFFIHGNNLVQLEELANSELDTSRNGSKSINFL